MNKMTNLRVSDRLEGFLAKPDGGRQSPALLVFMEAFGITSHIQNVCQRLADAGFVALAPDFFHGDVVSYGDMNTAMAKVQAADDDLIMQETAASLTWLESQPQVDKRRLGVIGFCMGGRLAFLANCRFPQQLKAAVGFYGSGISGDGPDRFGRTPPLGEAEKIQGATFLGFGADDTGNPPAQHARIAERLSTLKKRYTLAVYPGAGHAFLCDERSSYAPQTAKRAWPEAIEFLRNELNG